MQTQKYRRNAVAPSPKTCFKCFSEPFLCVEFRILGLTEPFPIFFSDFLFSFCCLLARRAIYFCSSNFLVHRKPKSCCHFHVAHTKDVYEYTRIGISTSLYIAIALCAVANIIFHKTRKALCTHCVCNHFHLLNANIWYVFLPVGLGFRYDLPMYVRTTTYISKWLHAYVQRIVFFFVHVPVLRA